LKVLGADFYFHMLQTTWPELLVYILFAYIFQILFWGTITYLAVGDDLDGSSRGLDNAFFTAIMFATENCITMGWGLIGATGAGAFVCGAIQQMCGIALNVLVFAIVCTKFQRPKPDILFANKVVVAPRDGIPTLLIRLGNKRCNIIYHPDVRLSFLCPTRTKEGETYIKSISLHIAMPNVIAGVFTISHPIDSSSPLKEHFGDDGKGLVSRAKAICVTCIGRDAVYQDDLHCIKRYNLGTDCFIDHQFVSCSGRDPNGNPMIDMSLVHDIESIKPNPLPAPGKKKKKKEEGNGIHLPPVASLKPIELLHLALDEKPASIARDQLDFASLYQEGQANLHVLVGALRLHPDNAQQPLVRGCCWSTGVEALCIEMGVPHETHLVDLRHKAAWLERLFLDFGLEVKPTLPTLMRVTHSGCELVPDSDACLESIKGWYPEVKEKLDINTKETAYPGGHKVLMERGVMPWFGFMMATPLTTLELWLNEEAQANRRKAIDAYCVGLQSIEDHLQSHEFLSAGEGPGIDDLRYCGVIGMMSDIEDYLVQDFVPERTEKFPKLQTWLKKIRALPGLQVQFLCDRKEYFATFFDYFLNNYAKKYVTMYPPELTSLFEANAPVLMSTEEKAKEEKQKLEKQEKEEKEAQKEKQKNDDDKKQAERQRQEEAEKERARRDAEKRQADRVEASSDEESDSDDEEGQSQNGTDPDVDAGEFALCL